MAVTAERLARETARANEAERHATEVLSMFKTTHEAKAKLEREVQRAKDELGLYKVQLDVAQKGMSNLYSPAIPSRQMAC
jgi:5-methylcytosine-specific restriction endonuclease McrBC regulatory subunit McrC